MANADGPVLPKPGVPKTLGILNIIFGVLLVLLGICMTGMLLMGPALLNVAEQSSKDVQAKIEAQQKASLKALDDQESAAKTEEEKKGDSTATRRSDRQQAADRSARHDGGQGRLQRSDDQYFSITASTAPA